MSDEAQELYLYEVTLRGVKTRLKLTRKEAKQLYGDNATEIGPAEKHAPVADTPTVDTPSVVGSKARTAKNKSAAAEPK